MSFIDTQLPSFSVLDAKPSSGKSNALALKAIFEKLQHPDKRIIIIKETNLACEILKK
jgi:hypothetical protein